MPSPTRRPNQMRLTAVEITEPLTISAQASERAAIEAYLEGLREEGLQPRLEHLENTDKEGCAYACMCRWRRQRSIPTSSQPRRQRPRYVSSCRSWPKAPRATSYP